MVLQEISVREVNYIEIVGRIFVKRLQMTPREQAR